MDVQSFENLARLLGAHAAGEVLLLAVARACEGNASLWAEARSAGIPWQRKNWTAPRAIHWRSRDRAAAGAGKREVGWW